MVSKSAVKTPFLAFDSSCFCWLSLSGSRDSSMDYFFRKSIWSDDLACNGAGCINCSEEHMRVPSRVHTFMTWNRSTKLMDQSFLDFFEQPFTYSWHFMGGNEAIEEGGENRTFSWIGRLLVGCNFFFYICMFSLCGVLQRWQKNSEWVGVAVDIWEWE